MNARLSTLTIPLESLPNPPRAQPNSRGRSARRPAEERIDNPGAGPTLHVELGAVARNTRTLLAHTSAEVLAVVKADGFGHAAAAVARTALANGASWLGTATIEEAVHLRRAGLTQVPILAWLHPVGANFGAALAAGIDLAIPSHEHLDAVLAAADLLGRTARVHLHADVGMARDGAAAEDWIGLCAKAARGQREERLEVVGVMGHLGCADRPADPANRAGIVAFDRARAQAHAAGLRPRWAHLAATAATLTNPAAHADLVRVGAGLYGIDPSGTVTLGPALTLTAPVVAVRAVPAGTAVGYGAAYRTRTATRLALLAIGYADGLPRAASTPARPGGAVALAGRRCPVVGWISMDQTVVEIGDAPVRPGDLAVVFGPGEQGEPTVRDWARAASTIEHEIVTGIGGRVRRHTSAVPQGQEHR